ncbi:hypothetical protein F511_17176 [Dorcoceras hygrometricum]|uniref:ICln family transporter: chloride ion current inducer protein I(Cln) n=1 Tax=Dorcoceras hygrometricum TaxID=472368 RepID=A0A2Z7D107_9LAMI|nr:hypothetical protein F511_17176 [Dorcoceras hygrometricum]
MDDPGMVSMFEALMASGLRGFLGCPTVVYEDALVDFFENASVRNGVVFSTVGEVAAEALVVEPLDVEEPRCSSADAVDLIIQQVLDETRADDAPADITEPAVTEEKNWFDLPYDDLFKQWEAERPVVMASDTEDEDVATAEVAPADEVQKVEEVEAPISAVDTVSADELTSLDDILLSIPVDIPLPSTCMEVTKIKMGQMIKIPGVTKWTWFLKHLPRIPAEDKGKEFKEEQVLRWGETESPQIAIQRKFYILLKYRTILVWKFLDAWRINFAPGQGSTAVDLQLALEQQQSSFSSSSSSLRFDHTDVDTTASSRLPISQDLSALFADFQATISEQLFESQSNISSKLHKIEQNVRDSLNDQAAVFKSLSQEARQENRTLDDVQTIRFNEFRKHVLEKNASIFIGLADVRKEVDAIHAKVDIMASRLNDIQKDAEATKEAHSHQLLEFQSQAQENHTVIHAQLSELVDYIHRGRADKKGETSGSRGPQQPAATQITGSAVTPSFEQRVQMAQRRLVQTQMKISADSLLKKFSSWFSLFVEESYTTSFKLVGTTAFWIDSAEAFFRDFSRCIVSADGYSDSIQQMLYMLLSSRCISKIAKRRHLIKLTRHRFC